MLMVAKTVKLPKALHDRIRRQARATGRTDSAVIREALERGLGEDEGIDMVEALKDFIGSATGGPTDLSTNKAYFNDFGRSRSR